MTYNCDNYSLNISFGESIIYNKLYILTFYHSQVLSAHFRAYIQALEKLQLDIATSSDLIGVETRSSGLFSTRREPLKNRSAVFALGDRINILKVLLLTDRLWSRFSCLLGCWYIGYY